MSAGDGSGVSSAETGAVAQKTEDAPKQLTQAGKQKNQDGTAQRAEMEARQDAINMRSIVDNRNPSDPQKDLHDLANKTSYQLAQEATELTKKQSESQPQPAGAGGSSGVPPENGIAVNPAGSDDGENSENGDTPVPQPTAEKGTPQEPQAASVMTPPPSTETPVQAQDAQAIREKRNNAARELLINDPNAKAYLETLGVTDPNTLNVAQEAERLGKIKNRTPQQEALLQRLQETQNLVLRQEAEATLDDMNKHGVDKNSKQYQEAREQFDKTEASAHRQDVRERIRQDSALREMLEKEGYNIEDFDIQQAIRNEGDSNLGKRLKEINGESETAVLQDGSDYDATPEERANRMRKIAKAGEHERGFWRRGLDKISYGIAQFSGAEIRDAFNQAKGWKQTIKAKQAELKKLLKDSNHDSKKEEDLNNDIKYAKHLRAEALKEAIGKRGLKIIFLLFLLMSAAIVVGPAILPAKLMEWGGKGAGGH